MQKMRGLSNPYFTAPNRLSNEFDDITGAAPASCASLLPAAAALSDTDGFSGGRDAATLASAGFGSAGLAAATGLAVSLGASFASFAVPCPGTNRVTAAFSLDAAVGGVAVAVVAGGDVVAVVSAVPMPILRARPEKKPPPCEV